MQLVSWELVAIVFPKHWGTPRSWTRWRGQQARYHRPFGWGSTRWLPTKRGWRRGSDPDLKSDL